MFDRPFGIMLLRLFVIISTLVSAAVLGLVFLYVFRQGSHLLSADLLRGNYHAQGYVGTLPVLDEETTHADYHSELDDVFWVERYGIALHQTTGLEGQAVIRVHHVASTSPFREMEDRNPSTESNALELREGMIIRRISYEGHPTSLTSAGAESMANDLADSERVVREVIFSLEGGGIRGSLVTTIYLIFLTLAIAMPLGVLTAVYFNEFAPVNRLTNTMRRFIETLTGVPSIIYGLLGITVFVPLTVRLTPATNTNLIAGALTLAVILLPTIIRTTEEALKGVPNDHRLASLALGADRTQTTFMVVIKQAAPGILTATFLGIGRVIGESAALIFVLGTAVKDRVNIFEPSTSLAVHIWSMLTDEPANIALSSAIALIMLVTVLFLNISIKALVFLQSARGGSS